ncbi:hypothetical protein DL96DRAFT_1581616 [Flagelloscypha sp. PMI_526]|nr:hypothetical protein DL96DRAFT_1581616 [Flagelloscypha sp. PMI_526]
MNAQLELDGTFAQNVAHNPSSLVARLPNDILTCIFILHKDAVMKDHRQGGQYARRQGFITIPWITPSYVCSSWRFITMNSSPFWSTLLLNNVSATRVLLRRSKQAPLDVGGTYFANRDSVETLVDCLSLALQESHRIESLDLSCVTFALQHATWRKVSQSLPAAFEGVEFPSLRTVTIQGTKEGGTWSGYYIIGRPLFLKFLKQPMRSLRELRMNTCPAAFWLALPPATTNTMTHLTLYLSMNAPVLTHLLSLLTTLSNLQSLDIEDVSSWRDRQDLEIQSAAFPKLVLSSLKSLALIIRPIHLTALLESIQFSNRLAHCRVQPQTQPPVTEFNVDQLLTRFLALQPKAKSASIEITGSKEGGTLEFHLSTFGFSAAIEHQTFMPSLSAWGSYNYKPLKYRSSYLPQMDVFWSRDYASGCLLDSPGAYSIDDGLIDTVETLLQEVEVLSLHLRVHHEDHFQVIDSWLSMLGRLPSIRRLDVWRSGVKQQQALLRCLSVPLSPPPHSSTMATKPFHFNALEQLNFERGAFCPDNPIFEAGKTPFSPLANGDRRKSGTPPQSSEGLFDVIEKRRCAENYRLRKLGFRTSSGVDSEVVQRLKQLVDEVEWDGIVLLYASPKILPYSLEFSDMDTTDEESDDSF